MKDDFGNRMKMLEGIENFKFMPLVPICVRIDGKCFHSFCKDLKRPYDERLSNLMIETTKYIVNETNACIGYTQSDEISIVLYSDDYKNKILFDGRIQKIVSVIASITTAYFNTKIYEYIPEKSDKIAFFDCRAWTVPTLYEASNVILWRELDAVKNSISMAAQSVYTQKELQGKNCSEMQEMLIEKGINWNDYPIFFKRGTYVQKRKNARKFTFDEIEKLPEKHEARKNNNLIVERSSIDVIEMPIFSRIINRNDVIFKGISPICK